jgi:hypothetical protein
MSCNEIKTSDENTEIGENDNVNVAKWEQWEYMQMYLRTPDNDRGSYEREIIEN